MRAFALSSLHCFIWFLLYYLPHLLSSNCFATLKLIAIHIWIYGFLKNHPRKIVFRNVSLSKLEDVFQGNLTTGRARECIFRVSGSINFKNFSAQQQPWQQLCGFDVCTSLPKKNSAYITELAREHALQITATKLVDSKTNGFSLQWIISQERSERETEKTW